MTRLRTYGMMLVALLLQMTVLNRLKFFGSVPDLLLILVVFLGLFSPLRRAVEAGIAAGLLADIFSLDFFGINIFIYVAAGLVANAMSAKVFRESKRSQAAIVFFLSALSMVVHYVVVSAVSRSFALGMPEYLAFSVLPAACYTTFVSIFVFRKLIAVSGAGRRDEYL